MHCRLPRVCTAARKLCTTSRAGTATKTISLLLLGTVAVHSWRKVQLCHHPAGRQHDFIETEKKLGRDPATLSSLAA